MIAITQNQVAEMSFISRKPYADEFNDVTLDAIFTDEVGREQVVPAFWAGGGIWRVRYSSPDIGTYSFRTVCSDAQDGDLHDQRGEIHVTPYNGHNYLVRHGPLRIAADHRHFEHIDGTPFLWLADTWWMGLCKRLEWPAGFQSLAIDRVRKGFNMIQIVAGLYPDMPAFDERGANEGGFPWERDYSRINPTYFDEADRRFQYVIDMGIVPCVVAAWGYHLPWLGVEKMKQHWRNMVARWGAYPVVWCVAGEGSMPYYLSENKDADTAFQKAGWTDIARYVREIDPFGNMITIHPVDSGRNTVDDPTVLDFDMLQTGHADRVSFPNTVKLVTEAYSREPRMPFINSEVTFEGIGEASRQEVQRLMFWSCMLGGATGHTYGANGIWQVNNREEPYGPSPHGMAWGNVPWEDAAQLPGSSHVALGKRFLERFEWWRFEPHPEWIQPHWTEENYFAPFAAGIPGKTRVIYFPPVWFGSGVVTAIEKDASYRAYLFNPVTAEETDLGVVTPDENGNWEPPCGNPPWKLLPILQDWVLVLEGVE
jgi:hypothetical protein